LKCHSSLGRLLLLFSNGFFELDRERSRFSFFSSFGDDPELIPFQVCVLQPALSRVYFVDEKKKWEAKRLVREEDDVKWLGFTASRRHAPSTTTSTTKKKKSFMTDICTYLAMWIYECTFPPWFPLYLRMWKSFTVLQVMRHIINDCVLCISTKEGTLRWCPFEKMGSTMKNADIVFRGRAYTIKNRNVINAKIELRLCDDVSKCSTHSRP